MIEYLNTSPLEKPLIFDTHAHYDDERFDGIRDELLTELPRHGVSGAVCCGCDIASSREALSLSEKYGYIYAAVGIHPCNADSNQSISEIEAMTHNKKCVAIGEIGLDYYWTQDNKPQQRALFCSQLEMSLRLNLPVIVHDREAHGDTLDILKEYSPTGVIHSFSGSPETAEQILDLGMYIGVGGVITFKNAKRLPEVVKMLPEDRLLLETDAPYLAPVPYRSKTNHSAMIYLSALKIAEMRGADVEHILKISLENAHRIFNIS